jgi:hypothetical protein
MQPGNFKYLHNADPDAPSAVSLKDYILIIIFKLRCIHAKHHNPNCKAFKLQDNYTEEPCTNEERLYRCTSLALQLNRKGVDAQ